MARRITIRFPNDRDDAFYFRVFCWADDTIYPALVTPSLGVIHDLDSVRDTVRIDVARHRHVNAIMKLIRETLPRHFPDADPVIDGPSNIGDTI